MMTLVMISSGIAFADPYPVHFQNISSSSQLGRLDLNGVAMRNCGSLDLNGDGFKELIITFDELAGRLYWGDVGAPISYDTNHDEEVWIGGVAPFPQASGVIFADFDNDEDLDFYAPNPDSDTNHQLFMNTGNDHFEDVTAAQGLSFTGDLIMFNHTINGVWGDYDGDTFVDLLLIQSEDDDEDPLGSNYQLLLHNNSGNGFSEAIQTGFEFTDKVVTALWADFDLDNDLDLILVQGSSDNGSEHSKYFENDKIGERYFFERTERIAQCLPFFAQNNNLAAVSDMNNDGILDIVYYNGQRYGIFLTNTQGIFEQIWASQIWEWTPRVWDIDLFDADFDGVTDMFVSKYDNDHPLDHAPRFYFGCEDVTHPIRFDDIVHYTQPCGGDRVDPGSNSDTAQKGVCVSDLDFDGTPEFFMTRTWYTSWIHGQTLFDYDSPTIPDGNWVGLTLESPYHICNRAALGATVVLTAEDHTQAQMIDGGSGRAGQSNLNLTYGLGDYLGPVDLKAILPNKGQVSGGSTVFLRQVPSGHYWDFDLDGILDNSVKTKLNHDLFTGEITLNIQWFSYDDTDTGHDQVSFYSDQPGAIAVSPEVYIGGHSIEPYGDEGFFLHKFEVEGLPCELGKKFFFSVQSKRGNTYLGSSMHTAKPATCVIGSNE